MKRRRFLLSLGLAGTHSLLAGFPVSGRFAGIPAWDSSPNILFILCDQLRQDAVDAYSHIGLITPVIDRLASDGIRFQNAYVAQPVCSPNRASILTGYYPHNHGVFVNGIPLPLSVKTLADHLRPLNYDCGYFGKWHLGEGGSQRFPTMPEYPNDGRGFGHYFHTQDGMMRYSVDVITDDAVRFIRAPRERPFYAYVSYYPPHPPYSVPDDYRRLYEARFPEPLATYYGMCTKVDEQIGRLLEALAAEGIGDNTIVVFTTDHGHFFRPRWNNNAKRLCYDGASLIPLIVRWSSRLPAGQIRHDLISSVDLTPTLLGLLDALPSAEFDGMDCSPTILKRIPSGRQFLLIENRPYKPRHTPITPAGTYNWSERCVITDDWKLILSQSRPPELYHRASDADEAVNLWPDLNKSQSARQLLDYLAQWQTVSGDSWQAANDL